MSIYVPGFDGDILVATNVDFSIPVGNATKNITVLGQVLMGSGQVNPLAEIVPATLVAGAGMVITPALGAPNTITFSSAGGITFASIAVPTLATAGTGWFADAPLTLTLPATAGLVDGDQVILICKNAGPIIIQANAAQVIQVSSVTSAVAGTATNTTTGDSLSLRFQVSSLSWTSEATSGNWTVV